MEDGFAAPDPDGRSKTEPRGLTADHSLLRTSPASGQKQSNLQWIRGEVIKVVS